MRSPKCEIVKAYRNKAKRCHPDVGGNEEEFRRIRDAYECLIGNPIMTEGRLLPGSKPSLKVRILNMLKKVSSRNIIKVSACILLAVLAAIYGIKNTLAVHNNFLGGLLVLGFCVTLYPLPSIIAFTRNLSYRSIILIFNIFAGWTVIGWVIPLLIALLGKDRYASAEYINIVDNHCCRNCNQCPYI